MSRTNAHGVASVCHRPLLRPMATDSAISPRLLERGGPSSDQKGRIGHRIQRLRKQPQAYPFTVGINHGGVLRVGWRGACFDMTAQAI
jgi:hypothetical protein